MRIAVAVSGGVDSLCALLLLRRAGHEVLALHAQLAEPAETGALALSGLERACGALGVPLHVADLRADFAREVVVPFAEAYAAGRTPNPCARCNRHIKFGALLDAALELGAEALATGHYARLRPGTRRGAPGPLLATAAHAPKD
ncbi:MAG: tRNA 2-thiouridine(34) synthase MnmA, partial [Desulfovibrio sp.]|nr:tRNA 2-thiouridine(34) synthase MnmA [Desulfovibrio sp.]